MPLKFGFPKLEDHPLKVPYTDAQSTDRICARMTSYYADLAGKRDIVIVCIGTDRSTGDSLGPLVGSRLIQLGFRQEQLFGTLSEPVHAMNLVEVMDTIHTKFDRPFIVAVDACLGQSASVGHIQVGVGPVKPGAGVNKDLPPVGDIHLTGIVNVGGFMEYFVLQNTRLSIVFNMADIIADSLYHSYQHFLKVSSAHLARLD